MDSHRGRRAFLAILKEAVAIEQIYFEPVLTELTKRFETSGLSRQHIRLAQKAARAAGAKVHYDHNASGLLSSLPQTSD